MQKWLDNNDLLMYSTHKEGKSVIVERFARTLKGKIYKKLRLMEQMLTWLFKSVSRWMRKTLTIALLVENLLILIILLGRKKSRRIPKLLNLRPGISSELLSTKISLAKFTPVIGQEEYLSLILWWRLTFGCMKVKINRTKTNRKLL